MYLPQDCWGGAWETAWGGFGERWLCASQLTGRVAQTFTLNGCKAAPPPWLRVCPGTDPDPPGLRPQREPKNPQRLRDGSSSARSSGAEKSSGRGETVGLSGNGGQSPEQGAGPAPSNHPLLKSRQRSCLRLGKGWDV